jgi:hypothetical protein
MEHLTNQNLEKLGKAQKEGRFAEFKRAERFGSGVTGYLIAYTPEVFVVEELHWDCFRLNGLIIFPRRTVSGLRIFTEADWPIKVARQLGIAKQAAFRALKRPYRLIVREIVGDSRLFAVEENEKYPKQMFLVECLESTKLRMRVKSYDRTLKRPEEMYIRFKDITKITVRDGYSRAVELALGPSESMVDISPASP